jgi:opacity protein-like surface antigen
MTNKAIKICCTLALLASVATTPAFSQAKNFAGPSIAIGGGYSSQTASLKQSVVDDNNISVTNGIGQNNFSALVDLSYGLELDKSFILSVGATYDLTESDIDIIIFDNGYLKSKLQDHYSLYLQPTFLVNNNTGIFGKLSYNLANYTGSILQNGVTRAASSDLEGWGYGIGAKTFLNNSTYIQVEGSYTEYSNYRAVVDNATSFSGKPKILSALMSVGYKF